MQYQLIPVGNIWQEGMIALPKTIATKYLKFSSEYQLKALLLILANNGTSDSKSISKALGCTEADATEFLEFWVEEGVLSCDGKIVEQKPLEQPKQEEAKPKKESVPVPVLTPSDIVLMCRENKELTDLMRHAQEVMGKTLSHVEQELILNMATYYGLPCDVVLTILQFYKNERAKGKAIGTSYIATMAKNWSEEGIVTLEAADEKLKWIEHSDRFWNEVIAIAGIKHRNPTIKQREMISRWSEDFDIQMIAIACDIMKEHTDAPNLKYVDSVLKRWKKKGIFTPEDVANEAKARQEQMASKDKPDIDKTYDIDEISRRAMMNDNFDI